MNKREFIGYIAKRQGVTKVIASKMYDAVIDGITSAVIEENVRLSLMGFGSFELKTHRGHPVRFKAARMHAAATAAKTNFLDLRLPQYGTYSRGLESFTYIISASQLWGRRVLSWTAAVTVSS